MKPIHSQIHKKTSISLPRNSHRKMSAARRVFARNGLLYSEQEIYRRLFKIFLKHWRGGGVKTNGLRRYNASGKGYEIHSLYINQVLYAALWQRALHSGESISRMLDVAIRVYLPRLLESLLSVSSRRPEPGRNIKYWSGRYARRHNTYPDFFINYSCHTYNNASGHLQYTQEMQIISKAGLSIMEIWNLMLTAA